MKASIFPASVVFNDSPESCPPSQASSLNLSVCAIVPDNLMRLCLTPIFAAAALVASVAIIAGESPSTPLPRPVALEPAIEFWTRIYGELDSASGLIHDEQRLDVIYRILYLNPAAAPSLQNRAIKGVRNSYRKALLALASGKRSNLNPIEKRALKAWGEQASKTELTEAAERLRFQRGQRDRFEQGLKRSKRWRKRIRAIFRQQDLPLELTALPHVESSYNPKARSKVGAAGLWQFMPATARRYLRVDAEVDERLDPYRSSQAAALFLKQNHAILKSWPLAITAYNHGISGVRRAMRETGTDDLGEIVMSYKGERFGFASRNFYAAFLAASDIAADPGRYFGPSAPDPATLETVVIPAYLPVKILAAGLGIDKGLLRRLNPNIHHGVWNGVLFMPKEQALRIPRHLTKAEATRILKQLAQHYGFSTQKPYRRYEVHNGDSLSVIAERHDSTVSRLVAMNRLSNAHALKAGLILQVPMGPMPKPLGTGAAAIMEAELAIGGLYGDKGTVITIAQTDLMELPEADKDMAEPDSTLDRCTPGSAANVDDAAILSDSKDSQPDLAADPVDYGVAADGTIEIQITETLGHYADWLDLVSTDLRQLNNMGKKKRLIVGHRLKLDFRHVRPKRFEQRRVAHHQARQLRYFDRYRIAGVREHRIKSGDNLWLLAEKRYRIPMWLLRQYNPDIDVDTVLALDDIIHVPLVEELPPKQRCIPAG